jgi:hypothetical protein
MSIHFVALMYFDACVSTCVVAKGACLSLEALVQKATSLRR